MIPERLPSGQAVAAHQGRLQNLFHFRAKTKRLVSISNPLVICFARRVVLKPVHLVHHPLDGFAFQRVHLAGQFAVVKREGLILV